MQAVPAATRVMVVEDEDDLRRLLAYNLESWGYGVEVAGDGATALRKLQEYHPHLVLLDPGLPDVSGLDVCRQIRRATVVSQPVVLMLSARGEEIDRVAGLETGADDYLVKPFSVRELMLRMDARLQPRASAAASKRLDPDRGQGGPPPRRLLEAGSLAVDPDGHHVYVGGVEVALSVLEMRLLLELMQSPGVVRTRKELLVSAWRYQPGVVSRTVDTHVKRLRDKLGEAGRLVETVRGVGYRFCEAT